MRHERNSPKDKKSLWLDLKAYRFQDLVPPHMTDYVGGLFKHEDASTLAFASKLARKFGWKGNFALRVILEYKKFVFLGVTGDGMVTPSKIIDQAWHEHFAFTRQYREFCKDVLGTFFDHYPELVPYDPQTGANAGQYQATLDRYRAEFNMEPPEDIWGISKFDKDKVKARSEESDTGPVVVSDDSSDITNLLLWQLFLNSSSSDASAAGFTPTQVAPSAPEPQPTVSFHHSISEPVGISAAPTVDNAVATFSSGGGDTGGSSCSGGGGSCGGGGGGGD